MSAFSNWNGPGGCEGMSAPQVKSINEMIAAYSALQTSFESLKADFNRHENRTIAKDENPHGVKDALATKQGVGLYLPEADAATIYARKDQVPTNNTFDQLANKVEVYANKVDTLNIPDLAALEAEIYGADGTGNTTGLKKQVADLIASLNNGGWTVDTAAALTSTAYNIKCLQIRCDNIKAGARLVFIVPIAMAATSKATDLVVDENTGAKGGTLAVQTAIVAQLSDEWYPVDTVALESQRIHSATIYLKYVNTGSYNAVVQAAYNYSYISSVPGSSVEDGSLDVTLAKSAQHKFIHFGLYKGTGADGKTHIYLGVAAASASGTPVWDVSSTVYVSGINIADTISPPNGTVHYLAGVAAGDSGKVVDKIILNELSIDKLTDKAGHDIVVVDETNNTLTIGNDLHDTIIHTEDRLTVASATSAQQVAYVSDLIQSIYWRRAVAVIVPTLNDLANINSARITILSDGSGTVIPWEPTPAAGHSNIPGIYTTSPSDPNPRGIRFGADFDTAIVMNYSTDSSMVDGLLNWDVTLQGTSNIPLSAVQGIDVEYIKVGATGAAMDGTLLKDNKGKIVKVVAQTVSPNTVSVVLYTGTYFAYAEPAYYKFVGNGWDTTAVPIPIPGSDPSEGYTRGISYQWSGYHLLDDGHWAQAYAVWTPHYANNATTTYDPDDYDVWSFTDWAINIYNLELPVGSVVTWLIDDVLGTMSIPVGFLKCDGSAYLQTAYPDLYALIGSRFNGTTPPTTGSFRVPDITNGIIRALK